MVNETLHIGFDDTDSTKRGCTTYVAALLVEKLLNLNVQFIDYPNLIRLNPNVPWKTRGNGALALRIRCASDLKQEIKEIVTKTVEEQSDLESSGTEPGIVFYEGTEIPAELTAFAEASITKVVRLTAALKLVKRLGAEAIGFKSGRGIIGGLAAIGQTLDKDHTFEILTYRVPRNRGSRRRVDEASIFEMNKATEPHTFNNVDIEKRRVIITPRGADPILLGIRGETPQAVVDAFRMVRVQEPIERWVVFRTNQGTDMHLRRITNLSEAKPYTSVIVQTTVATKPLMLRGKHVVFSASDNGENIDCAAYEPTGVLRKRASKLSKNDVVEVYGAVRKRGVTYPLTINLEKLRVLKLAREIAVRNPTCPRCRKRLKSMGKNQGFRCEKCGLKYPGLEKAQIYVERELKRGLYITSARSQRHLTKPFSRYGLEKRKRGTDRLIDQWHFP